MKEKANITDRINGYLTILAREEGGEWFLLQERKNSLVGNSKTLIASALAGNTGWKIDTIKAYKAGVLLASSLTTYTLPASNQVQFQTIFSLSSFNDTLDEVRLNSVVGGDFSAVSGLSINKPNTLELSIQWLLTII